MPGQCLQIGMICHRTGIITLLTSSYSSTIKSLLKCSYGKSQSYDCGLMWLTIFLQYMTRPTEKLVKAQWRVMGYKVGTPHFKICYNTPTSSYSSTIKALLKCSYGQPADSSEWGLVLREYMIVECWIVEFNTYSLYGRICIDTRHILTSTPLMRAAYTYIRRY